MSKTIIYVAGSWKNRLEIKNIMEEIESWEYNVAVDWTKHQEKGGARQYAEEDLKGLKECDCLVYCNDGIKSRGKNFELGYITALNKPVAIYVFPTIWDSVEDRYGSYIDSIIGKECVFIRANIYPIIRTKKELKVWLSNIKI